MLLLLLLLPLLLLLHFRLVVAAPVVRLVVVVAGGGVDAVGSELEHHLGRRGWEADVQPAVGPVALALVRQTHLRGNFVAHPPGASRDEGKGEEEGEGWWRPSRGSLGVVVVVVAVGVA